MYRIVGVFRFGVVLDFAVSKIFRFGMFFESGDVR